MRFACTVDVALELCPIVVPIGVSPSTLQVAGAVRIVLELAHKYTVECCVLNDRCHCNKGGRSWGALCRDISVIGR